MDSTSIPENLYPKKDTVKEKMTIGVPRHFLEEGIDKDVLEEFEKKLKELESLGHTVTDIKLPNVEYSLAAYYVIMPAEASTNLARYDGVRYGLHKDGKDSIDDYKESRGEGFGMEVRRRIMIGTYVLSSGYYDTYYGKALVARRQITNDFNTVFESVDVIATPTTPTPAFKFGEKEDPLSMYLTDILTVPANITGDPAISIPIGTVKRDGVKLPLGIQLIAPRLCDKRLFALGHDVEKR